MKDSLEKKKLRTHLYSKFKADFQKVRSFLLKGSAYWSRILYKYIYQNMNLFPFCESIFYTKLTILCVFPYSSPFDNFPIGRLNSLHPQYYSKDLQLRWGMCTCYRQETKKMQNTKTLDPGPESLCGPIWLSPSSAFTPLLLLLLSTITQILEEFIMFLPL